MSGTDEHTMSPEHKPGTDSSYFAMRTLSNVRLSCNARAIPCPVLSYRVLCHVRYWPAYLLRCAVRCPVLTERMELPGFAEIRR
eukprot:3940914-Rhodomonas_salina.2